MACGPFLPAATADIVAVLAAMALAHAGRADPVIDRPCPPLRVRGSVL